MRDGMLRVACITHCGVQAHFLRAEEIKTATVDFGTQTLAPKYTKCVKFQDFTDRKLRHS
jgi:hypothetical protein